MQQADKHNGSGINCQEKQKQDKHQPMKIIGITGGSGSGKSTLCRLLEQQGIPVLDTDRVAHEITQTGAPVLTELAQAFGTQILDETGALRRQVLADLVFGTENEQEKKERQETLNRITHKYVWERTKVWLRSQHTDICVLDVPLLFESGMNELCDLCVGVTASVSTRTDRIIKRDGITPQRAQARIAAQPNDDFYHKHCDMLITNDKNTTMADLQAAVLAILKRPELQS